MSLCRVNFANCILAIAEGAGGGGRISRGNFGLLHPRITTNNSKLFYPSLNAASPLILQHGRGGGGRNAQLTVDAVSGRTARGGTLERSLARSLARLSGAVIGDERGPGGVPIAAAVASERAALSRSAAVPGSYIHTRARGAGRTIGWLRALPPRSRFPRHE